MPKEIYTIDKFAGMDCATNNAEQPLLLQNARVDLLGNSLVPESTDVFSVSEIDSMDPYIIVSKTLTVDGVLYEVSVYNVGTVYCNGSYVGAITAPKNAQIDLAGRSIVICSSNESDPLYIRIGAQEETLVADQGDIISCPDVVTRYTETWAANMRSIIALSDTQFVGCEIGSNALSHLTINPPSGLDIVRSQPLVDGEILAISPEYTMGTTAYISKIYYMFNTIDGPGVAAFDLSACYDNDDTSISADFDPSEFSSTYRLAGSNTWTLVCGNHVIPGTHARSIAVTDNKVFVAFGSDIVLDFTDAATGSELLFAFDKSAPYGWLSAGSDATRPLQKSYLPFAPYFKMKWRHKIVKLGQSDDPVTASTKWSERSTTYLPHPANLRVELQPEFFTADEENPLIYEHEHINNFVATINNSGGYNPNQSITDIEKAIYQIGYLGFTLNEVEEVSLDYWEGLRESPSGCGAIGDVICLGHLAVLSYKYDTVGYAVVRKSTEHGLPKPGAEHYEELADDTHGGCPEYEKKYLTESVYDSSQNGAGFIANKIIVQNVNFTNYFFGASAPRPADYDDVSADLTQYELDQDNALTGPYPLMLYTWNGVQPYSQDKNVYDGTEFLITQVHLGGDGPDEDDISHVYMVRHFDSDESDMDSGCQCIRGCMMPQLDIAATPVSVGTILSYDPIAAEMRSSASIGVTEDAEVSQMFTCAFDDGENEIPLSGAPGSLYGAKLTMASTPTGNARQYTDAACCSPDGLTCINLGTTDGDKQLYVRTSDFTTFDEPWVDYDPSTFTLDGIYDTGTPLLKITVTDDVNGTFEADKHYVYRFAMIFDGSTITPLSEAAYHATSVNKFNTDITMTITTDMLSTMNKRITAVLIFVAECNSSLEELEYYRLLKKFDFRADTLPFDSGDSEYSVTYADSGNRSASFDALAGYSETASSTSVKRSCQCLHNNYLFAGDSIIHKYTDTGIYTRNVVVRSMPLQVSTFDYSKDFAVIPFEPNVLVGNAGYIYAFGDSQYCVINAESMALEYASHAIGCKYNRHALSNEHGVFVLHGNALYHVRGAEIAQISQPISINTSAISGIPTMENTYDHHLCFSSKRQAIIMVCQYNRGVIAFMFNIDNKQWVVYEIWGAPSASAYKRKLYSAYTVDGMPYVVVGTIDSRWDPRDNVLYPVDDADDEDKAGDSRNLYVDHKTMRVIYDTHLGSPRVYKYIYSIDYGVNENDNTSTPTYAKVKHASIDLSTQQAIDTIKITHRRLVEK